MATVEPSPKVPGSTPSCAVPTEPATEPTMSDRMKEQASHVSERAQEFGNQAKEAAQQKLAQAQEQAAQYYAQGREKATELTHQAEQYIRTEPTKALLAAAGVGFVLGMLVVRR